MEGSLPTSNMMPASNGVPDLQRSMRMHHQRHHPQASFRRHQQQPSKTQHQSWMVNLPMHEVFPSNANHMKDGKTSMSDDGDASFTEDRVDDQDDAGKGKKGSLWQRMKWTDGMVRLLINAVSYVGEDAMPEYNNGGRRKCAVLQKKIIKWKPISKVMAERGCYISPQQCEDKFNDLNKRYRRLVDILGRGTACMVVENPALLDQMEHIPDRLKDEVKRILSSKHLFYEEMCSYHNANRLHLPHDPALQRSLQHALRSKDEQSTGTCDEEDEAPEHTALHGDAGGSCSLKRLKHWLDHEEAGFRNPSGLQVCRRSLHPQDMSAATWRQKHLKNFPSVRERRWNIQLQMQELERQRFKWQQFSKKEDRELNKMRMENENMKLENERLVLELKSRELEVALNLKRYQ